jgi:hypothetical protein
MTRPNVGTSIDEWRTERHVRVVPMSRRSGAHQARALECGALVVAVAPTEWRAIIAWWIR